MNWNEVRLEIQRTGGIAPQDTVRRSKISAVEQITGNPLVIYAVDFLDGNRASQYGVGLQIDLTDKTGFIQALSDIPNGPLDVLVHSPGGSATATESIVKLLRSRFDPVRFFVPHTAKSAATMLALSGDEILVGEAAEFGPIDPQLRVVGDQRSMMVPAGAAIDQLARIHSDIAVKPDSVRAWLPIIRQYGPSFLEECHNALDLSQRLVTEWLEQFMFRDDADGKCRATKIANWLSKHSNFKSHARPVWMEQFLEVEPSVKMKSLRQVSEQLEAAVLELFWAIDVTFVNTNAFKIIEHRDGSAYVRLQQVQHVLQGPQPPQRQQPPQRKQQPRKQQPRKQQPRKKQPKKKRR